MEKMELPGMYKVVKNVSIVGAIIALLICMFVIAIGLKNMINVGVLQGMPLFVTGLLYMAITITVVGLILLFLGLVRIQIDIRNMLIEMQKKDKETEKSYIDQ
jgi:TRAP-type C4-dicarboxylate transport system permease small subunit